MRNIGLGFQECIANPHVDPGMQGQSRSKNLAPFHLTVLPSCQNVRPIEKSVRKPVRSVRLS
jgi:hypothetical protein